MTDWFFKIRDAIWTQVYCLKNYFLNPSTWKNSDFRLAIIRHKTSKKQKLWHWQSDALFLMGLLRTWEITRWFNFIQVGIYIDSVNPTWEIKTKLVLRMIFFQRDPIKLKYNSFKTNKKINMFLNGNTLEIPIYDAINMVNTLES